MNKEIPKGKAKPHSSTIYHTRSCKLQAAIVQKCMVYVSCTNGGGSTIYRNYYVPNFRQGGSIKRNSVKRHVGWLTRGD